MVRVHRSAVITFAAITFLLPMLFGTAIGLALGWIVPAALLLGALLSSHTLLLYPAARRAGLSADRGVATAVGATVLTDTAALIVLAGVSGSQLAGGSRASIALTDRRWTDRPGRSSPSAFSPGSCGLAFRYLGTDRVIRYLLAVAAFLAAATVADIFGIEPIVGAFFAGLALNRLVPNEGPLMDRIDFFGSAVFVPVFLVSVGMLLDPAVMVEGETLKLAGLFILASFGGKAIASAFARVALGYSSPQAVLMLGLTVPQAAATLAATIVGFNIGLFDQSVVNAALVLILVSIVVGTLLVERSEPWFHLRGQPASGSAPGCSSPSLTPPRPRLGSLSLHGSPTTTAAWFAGSLPARAKTRIPATGSSPRSRRPASPRALTPSRSCSSTTRSSRAWSMPRPRCERLSCFWGSPRCPAPRLSAALERRWPRPLRRRWRYSSATRPRSER